MKRGDLHLIEEPPPAEEMPGYLDETGRPAGEDDPGLHLLQRDLAPIICEAAPGLRTVCAADVQPEVVRFLLQGRIPFGKLTIADGRAGLGKTTVLLDLAARLTRGDPMPDGVSAGGGPRAVLFVSAEDGAADTLVPRLEAAGADLGHVHFLAQDEHLDLQVRLHDLRTTVERYAIGLVVLDPLSAMMGRVDAHRDGEVRSVLAPVAALASEAGVAIVGIRHVKKGRGHAALDAGGGSVAFGAAARSVLLVARHPNADPEDPRRYLAATKGNLAAHPPTLEFRLVTRTTSTGDVPAIEWVGIADLSADELLADPKQPRAAPERDRAVEFLLDTLADGPVNPEAIYEEAEAEGLSRRTVERAKKTLGICSAKRPGQAGRWVWFLPDQDRQPSQSGGGGGVGDVCGESTQGRQHHHARHVGGLGAITGGDD